MELSRQDYTSLDYTGIIYFEKMTCLNDRQVSYSGKGDKSLLSEPGLFHTHSEGTIVFQNRLIGFTFNFSWEKQGQLFVLEKTALVNQQNNQSEHIRYFYQKEEL